MLAPLFHKAQTPIPLQVMVQYTCVEPMVFQVDPIYLPLDGIDFQFGEGLTVNGYMADEQTGLIELEADVHDYRGFGRAVFYGYLGGDVFELSVYVVECCDDNPSFNSFMAEPYPLSFWENSGLIDADYVLVMGEVPLDISLDVQSSTLEMGVDARFVADPGVDVTTMDSEFLPYCRYYWDGIHLHHQSNTISFESSTMKGATRGLYLRDNVVAQFHSSYFEDNLRAICLFDFTDNGPFETNSFVEFDNNDFHVTISDINCLANLSLTCEQHPSSPIDMRNYTPPAKISQSDRTIMVFGSNAYFRVGSQNLNQNNFEDKALEEHIHIGAAESTVIIQNNYFENAVGVMTENTRVVVGGDQPSEANEFKYSRILTEVSSAYIKNNDFMNVNPVMSNSSLGLVFQDVIHDNFPGYTSGLLMEDNNFINYSEVRVVNDLASVSNYRVVDNNFSTSFNTGLQLNFIRLQANANGRLYVANNTLTRLEIGDDSPLLSMSECHGAGIYENGIGGTIGNGGVDMVGVYMYGSDDVDIVENLFYAPPQLPGHNPEHYTFHACVEMEGENRNARVHCNTFQQPYYGIKLTDAIVDDFGHISVGANNVFMQNVQWSMVPIQNAIYGNTVNFKPTYYADYTFSSVINGFETGVMPTEFGGKDVSGEDLDIEEDPGIDGCEPDPLPIDELNVVESDLLSNDYGISLYPNPSIMNGEVNIEVAEHCVARIVDVQGREIATWNLSKGANNKVIDLPSGMYYVNIVFQSQNKTIKWIVQ